jgi:hypothetical protein
MDARQVARCVVEVHERLCVLRERVLQMSQQDTLHDVQWLIDRLAPAARIGRDTDSAFTAPWEGVEPSGPRFPTVWGETQAYMFAVAPNGMEYEILNVEKVGSTVSVTLKMPAPVRLGSGDSAWTSAKFTYPAGREVFCRESNVTRKLHDAMDILKKAFDVTEIGEIQ